MFRPCGSRQFTQGERRAGEALGAAGKAPGVRMLPPVLKNVRPMSDQGSFHLCNGWASLLLSHQICFLSCLKHGLRIWEQPCGCDWNPALGARPGVGTVLLACRAEPWSLQWQGKGRFPSGIPLVMQGLDIFSEPLADAWMGGLRGPVPASIGAHLCRGEQFGEEHLARDLGAGSITGLLTPAGRAEEDEDWTGKSRMGQVAKPGAAGTKAPGRD